MLLPPAGPELEQFLAELPDRSAVFVLSLGDAAPYLGRTALLARRIRRLLRPTLYGERATALEFWPTASRLDSALLLYRLARQYYPQTYRKLIKLRLPSYLKVLLSNEFPRTTITARLSRSGLHYGPFRSRAAAETLEASVLEHFQIRRCAEDLAPSPEHPGCMYGEMNLCLRPCQAVVSPEGYATEVHRLTEFLSTGGRSLLDVVERSRDRFSAEMEFEQAARQHQRLDKIAATLRLRDDLVMPFDAAHGIAVTPSPQPAAVHLHLLLNGSWQPPQLFSIAPEQAADRPVSLDRRLRELLEQPLPPIGSLVEREEHLALLARWYYSSWRDGEWLPLETVAAIPYRRLVNMVHRVATQATP
jgi:excinuclease ABC subunit C